MKEPHFSPLTLSIDKGIPTECLNATIETNVVISQLNTTHKHIHVDALHSIECINYTSALQACKSMCHELTLGNETSKCN